MSDILGGEYKFMAAVSQEAYRQAVVIPVAGEAAMAGAARQFVQGALEGQVPGIPHIHDALLK